MNNKKKILEHLDETIVQMNVALETTLGQILEKELEKVSKDRDYFAKHVVTGRGPAVPDISRPGMIMYVDPIEPDVEKQYIVGIDPVAEEPSTGIVVTYREQNTPEILKKFDFTPSLNVDKPEPSGQVDFEMVDRKPNFIQRALGLNPGQYRSRKLYNDERNSTQLHRSNDDRTLDNPEEA